MGETSIMSNPARESVFFKAITKDPLKSTESFIKDMKAYFRVAYMEPIHLTAAVFEGFVPQGMDRGLNFSESAFVWVEHSIVSPASSAEQKTQAEQSGQRPHQVYINTVSNYLEWSEHTACMILAEGIVLDGEAKQYYDSNQWVTAFQGRKEAEKFNSFRDAIKKNLGNQFQDKLWEKLTPEQKAITNAEDILRVAEGLLVDVNAIKNIKKEYPNVTSRASKKTEHPIENSAQCTSPNYENEVSPFLEGYKEKAVALYNALNRVGEHLIEYGDRHFKAFGFGHLMNQFIYVFKCINNAYVQWQKKRTEKKQGTPAQPLLNKK